MLNLYNPKLFGVHIPWLPAYIQEIGFLDRSWDQAAWVSIRQNRWWPKTHPSASGKVMAVFRWQPACSPKKDAN